jgi:hypothetical protein
MSLLQSSQHHPQLTQQNEVALLRNDGNEQVSLISESVAATRINLHLARETTWQHSTQDPRRHHEWQQFMMTIKESSQVHRTLVHVFHTITQRASVGGPHTISCTSCRYGRVSSNSVIVKATMLTWPHKSCMHQCIFKLAYRGPSDQSLIDSGGGYHLRSSEYKNRPLSPFLSGILYFSLIALPGLILCHHPITYHKPHRTSIDRKSPITNDFLPLVFYR